MSTPRFLKQLQEFVASKADFSIIYSTSASFINSNTQRVCVLDSSFNPPHLGHYALVEESLTKNYDNIPLKDKAVLLLLSVKNADKTHPKPEPFETRLELMYLMANDLAKKYPVNISIGLTSHAKFVDKSLSVLNYIRENEDTHFPDIKLTFLVGFDTLIRIFNPKYYLPDKLSNSLEQFMKNTDLFCLTRTDETFSHDQQSKYVDDIKRGSHEEIPSHWSDNIYLLENIGNNSRISTISSSAIRKCIKDQDEIWKSEVLPEVSDYIVQEELYKQ
ncbi:Nicotinamide mononucleotide adenylyltransferase [Candida viswanathii]|uniref:Nicotinamide mononucleotide adenylyltransferase n=1 Tax=Candida viswanathii TaxID=5486 RepID=A0A367YE38_9ASCO|nr:Nicotinamide mononucleotide adenylyltransferase [Candida viswanathii]